MIEKTQWCNLNDHLLVDIAYENVMEIIVPGSRSREKKKQTLREQSVLGVIYLTRNMQV